MNRCGCKQGGREIPLPINRTHRANTLAHATIRLRTERVSPPARAFSLLIRASCHPLGRTYRIGVIEMERQNSLD